MDRMERIARQITQQAAAEAGKRAPGARVSAKVSVNPAEHSYSSVRHHHEKGNEGGTFVPPLDEMPQAPVRPPGRRGYDSGDINYHDETPRKWGEK